MFNKLQLYNRKKQMINIPKLAKNFDIRKMQQKNFVHKMTSEIYKKIKFQSRAQNNKK